MNSTTFIILCFLTIVTLTQAQLPTDSINIAIVEQEFVTLLNTTRTNPKSFLPILDKYKTFAAKRTNDKKGLEKALKEIRDLLLKQQPLSKLDSSVALYKAAKDHANDISKNTIMGHIGSDKSNPKTRIEKYGTFMQLGEIITYGQPDAEMMLAAFLVDEGTPDRGHRLNVLNSNFRFMGLAIATHKTYGNVCVVTLGGN